MTNFGREHSGLTIVKVAALEHLLCPSDYRHSVGSAIRLPSSLLFLPSLSYLGTGHPHRTLNVSNRLDLPVHQDRQALGSLLPLSRRCSLLTHLHWIRLLPRPNQAVGSLHA